MSEIRVTVTIEVDGQALPDMPIIKTVQVAEVATIPNLIAAFDSNSSSFHPIQAAIMPTMGFFFMQADQAMNYKINTAAPALPMNAGSLLLWVSSNLTQATANTNVQINNPSTTTNANLSGLIGGS